MLAARTMIITAAVATGVLAAVLGGSGLGQTDGVPPPVLPIAALASMQHALAAPRRPAVAMTPLPAVPMAPWH